MRLLYGLALTLLFETVIYFLFLKKKNNISFLSILIMNLITNLTFNSLYIYVFNYSDVYLIIGEVVVVLVELIFYSIIIKGFNVRSLVAPLLANALSLGLGFVFNDYVLPLTNLKNLTIILVIALVFELVIIESYLIIMLTKND